MPEVSLVGQILLEYRGRRETLNEIGERAISAAIARLSASRVPWIAVIEGHGERAIDGQDGADLGRLGAELTEQGFLARPLDLGPRHRGARQHPPPVLSTAKHPALSGRGRAPDPVSGSGRQSALAAGSRPAQRSGAAGRIPGPDHPARRGRGRGRRRLGCRDPGRGGDRRLSGRPAGGRSRRPGPAARQPRLRDRARARLDAGDLSGDRRARAGTRPVGSTARSTATRSSASSPVRSPSSWP